MQGNVQLPYGLAGAVAAFPGANGYGVGVGAMPMGVPGMPSLLLPYGAFPGATFQPGAMPGTVGMDGLRSFGSFPLGFAPGDGGLGDTAALADRLNEQLNLGGYRGGRGYGARQQAGNGPSPSQGPYYMPNAQPQGASQGPGQPLGSRQRGRGGNNRGQGLQQQGGRAQQQQQQQQQKKKRFQKGLEDNIKRTVYISYVDHQVTEEALATFFSDCGRIVDCRICGDPNSAMRFAFIEFLELESIDKALDKTGIILGGSPLRVLPSKTAIVPVNRELMPRSQDEIERCSRTVYAANIDKKVDKNDVKQFFESLCGKVSRIRLLGDYAHTTRIAFVEFLHAEGALAALNCSGALLGSLPIRVSPSKTPVRIDSKEDGDIETPDNEEASEEEEEQQQQQGDAPDAPPADQADEADATAASAALADADAAPAGSGEQEAS